MKINFNTLEYTDQGLFNEADYMFEGNVDTGWQILRKGQRHLILGEGYRLMKTRMCGICSTDLARRFLPFPLPQVIGHEVIAEDPESMEKSVVEINDTPYSRGDKIQDVFCRSGLHTHSPGRMVLGIDRLPGGFGPYILVPKNAVVPIQDLSEYSGVLIEPFAAAFHAITVSPPGRGDSVAVLGPRRLGALLIAGLKAYRRLSGADFKIYALAKYKNILRLCSSLGSDHEIDLANVNEKSITDRFDIVYDTTGTESGFELALKLAKREVHLKSTSGRKVCGFNNLTPFVVDEFSLLPFSPENIDFIWAGEKRENRKIYAATGVG
ncbi:MAG: alcohol dehydrogenase catalytic domain-containing protein, partial [Deltaproteobacteria bacterium]|nr:alcohol dehydrogenase catalytic domain-containing protein [Deltaproteobacteria bacterium]